MSSSSQAAADLENTLTRLPIALKRDRRAQDIEAERKRRMEELFKYVMYGRTPAGAIPLPGVAERPSKFCPSQACSLFKERPGQAGRKSLVANETEGGAGRLCERPCAGVCAGDVTVPTNGHGQISVSQ